MNEPQSNCIRKLFLQAKQSIVALLPAYLATVVDREFHAMITFTVVFFMQMVYIQYLLSGGSFGEKNFIARYSAHLHIVLLLLGGAILRCLVGFLILGQHVRHGSTFDYPHEARRDSEQSLKSDKMSSPASGFSFQQTNDKDE